MDFLAAMLRLWAPLGLAALGGTLSERVGVIALGLEAMLLAGAYTAVAVAAKTGSAALGALAGALAGALVGLLHACLVLFARVPAVLSGVGLNLGLLGLTTFLLRAHGEVGLSTQARFPAELAIPLALALVLALAFLLGQTPLGLRLRACGEKPEAVRAAGLNPDRLRLGAVSGAGGLAGLGGVLLALMGLGEFTENMTSGRGYIALAAVILGRWSPLGAAGAALLFTAGDALVGTLQNAGLAKALPPDLLQLLPYLAALVALGLVKGRGQAPASLSTT
ncbi:ABC transporter permease subunit [Armatimonas rosea]|uniref:Simple sugar transport system permease protein n=1 Tax=Armatimonas rosea TaxID=685828 RepID=A0A7W9W5X9_ARMRO|nr:ABC transporter permease [Armatimonas rosea]MBB6050899.1 simple sugar transport system permease protein [Armatimonas rosea]